MKIIKISIWILALIVAINTITKARQQTRSGCESHLDAAKQSLKVLENSRNAILGMTAREANMTQERSIQSIISYLECIK